MITMDYRLMSTEEFIAWANVELGIYDPVEVTDQEMEDW